ncbi:hypothetical protein ACTXT7_016973 [Hymenolepis weldensis]
MQQPEDFRIFALRLMKMLSLLLSEWVESCNDSITLSSSLPKVQPQLALKSLPQGKQVPRRTPLPKPVPATADPEMVPAEVLETKLKSPPKMKFKSSVQATPLFKQVPIVTEEPIMQLKSVSNSAPETKALTVSSTIAKPDPKPKPEEKSVSVSVIASKPTPESVVNTEPMPKSKPTTEPVSEPKPAVTPSPQLKTASEHIDNPKPTSDTVEPVQLLKSHEKANPMNKPMMEPTVVPKLVPKAQENPISQNKSEVKPITKPMPLSDPVTTIPERKPLPLKEPATSAMNMERPQSSRLLPEPENAPSPLVRYYLLQIAYDINPEVGKCLEECLSKSSPLE